MSINIYSIANHLSENGWKLISDSYKNLNSELEAICPNGHQQIITYGQWRKYPHCDICMGGAKNKVKGSVIPPKKINSQRILALDAATNTTGYSVYDDGELVAYGVFKTDSKNNLTERINEVKLWLKNMLEQHQIDFLGIENIQLETYGHNNFQVQTYNALARLQGVLLDAAFEMNVDSDLAYATEWRKYCGVGGGTGRENKKKQAQDKVKVWYGKDCTQDEADAICIGKYFCHMLKNSHSSWGEDIE